MRLVCPPARTALRLWPTALPALCVLLASHLAAADKPQPAAREFEKDVLPILQARCLKCHGADQQKAELDLRSRAALLRGGETGPGIAPGSAESSLLWKMTCKALYYIDRFNAKTRKSAVIPFLNQYYPQLGIVFFRRGLL